MKTDKMEVSEIVGVASKHAGAFAGKATVIGKKIAGIKVSGAAAVKDLLSWPDEQIRPASKASTLEQR